jgi:hypothetical protein
MPYKVPVASLMGILPRSLSIAVMTSVIVTELKANAENVLSMVLVKVTLYNDPLRVMPSTAVTSPPPLRTTTPSACAAVLP